MKKPNEYIFADELKPKTFWQKIMHFFGKYDANPEKKIVINRPTYEELGLSREVITELVSLLQRCPELFEAMRNISAGKWFLVTQSDVGILYRKGLVEVIEAGTICNTNVRLSDLGNHFVKYIRVEKLSK